MKIRTNVTSESSFKTSVASLGWRNLPLENILRHIARCGYKRYSPVIAMTLSVIIITKNEAEAIRRCLASVTWADEIIVVDSGSTDGTPDICREFGAAVTVTQDWPGFGPQKNRALDLASKDWVLSLDADEWLTAETRQEIEQAITKNNGAVGYRLPRLSSFCGTYLKHGGWWPDYVERLFRRGAARFSDDLVHERLIIKGEVQTLQSPLMHESMRDLDEVLNKLNAYTTAGANMMRAKGKRASLATALAHGLWAFVRSYIFRTGFLDGSAGFIQAVTHGEATYYRYLKLALLNKNANIIK
jgi:glycosyltransferase involved in cell wall biosynthesis